MTTPRSLDLELLGVADTVRTTAESARTARHIIPSSIALRAVDGMTHLMAKIASASGRQGLSTILHTRDVPRPLRRDRRVVEA